MATTLGKDPLLCADASPGQGDHNRGMVSLKDLLTGIEKETNSQFDILSENYVFYVPEAFLSK